MSLLLNMLSRLVITFLPRSKCLFISWLQSPSVVILEPKKIKSDTVSTVPHLFPMKWWDRMPWSSFSECWALSQLLHSPPLLSSGGFFVPLEAHRQVKTRYVYLHLQIRTTGYRSSHSFKRFPVSDQFLNKNYICLRCTLWFDIHSEMFTLFRAITIFSRHISYHFRVW